MEKAPIEIRDQREQEWFWGSNQFVDFYAEIVGDGAVAAYTVLCRFANNSTQKCWPSLDTIAKKAGMKSRKTAALAIAALEEYNIISVDRGVNDEGKRTNNVYKLNSPKVWKPVPSLELSHGVIVEDGEIKNVPVKLVKKVEAEVDFTLYPWLDQISWKEWEQHRKEKKVKLTPSAIKKQLKVLFENQNDQAAIIDKSIANNWQGLFPIRRSYNHTSPIIAASKGKYDEVSQ